MTDRPDARLAAARYAAGDRGEPAEAAGRPTPDQRAAAVEVAIQQAMRRGDFDGLPGAGKPLPGLGGVRDPDWWIRRKIERERLTGLGPPALTLRTEDRELDDRLDGIAAEALVREALTDFNARVREARRQLLGGPPVVTHPRDVEAEVLRWRARAEERREAAERAAALARERAAAELAGLTRRERRRVRRAARGRARPR